METASLLEFVGFDLLFIGILTVVVVGIGVRLWNQSSCRDLCANTLKDCGDLFGGSAKKTAGVLILAAVAGMIANFMADQLLDSGMFRCVPLPEIEADTVWDFIEEGPPAGEDEIKLWVLCRVVKKGMPKQDLKEALSPDFVARYGDPQKTKAKDLEKMTEEELEKMKTQLEKDDLDEAKGFFQEALAAVLQSGSDAVVTSLRAEFMVVRVFRVLFLYSLLLVLATAAACLNRRNWARKQIMPWAATVFSLVCISYLLLWCWGHQSKRYYKKLAHTSFAVSSAPKNVDLRPPR